MAPGGTYIRRAAINAIANAGFVWTVRATDFAAWSLGPTAPALAQFGTGTATSVVRYGRVLPANRLAAAACPYSYRAARDPMQLDDLVYVPKGSYFLMDDEAANQACAFEITFQDLPAMAGPQ